MSVASHYDGSAATYGDQYDPDKLWTNAEYPANYFRLQLVQRLLAEAGATSLYELGVGDATPLARIGASGLRVAGQRRLARDGQGRPRQHVRPWTRARGDRPARRAGLRRDRG